MAETRLRSFRCPDAVWQAAIDRADRTGESVTGALVAALRAWGTDTVAIRLADLTDAEIWASTKHPDRLKAYYADRDAPGGNLQAVEDDLIANWRARA